MKDRKVIFNFIISLLSTLVIFYVIYTCASYLKCFAISKKITLPAEQEYLRIKIFGSSNTYEGNTISGTFSIIDTNGNEIALIERSWSGAYLAVQFNDCSFSGKTFYFPGKIYGKNRINETNFLKNTGTNLEKYYDENGQCMLLGYGSTLKDRQKLYTLARFATRKIPVFDFGTTNIITIDLSSCKTEVYYSIKKNIYGNLVIEEL